MLFDQQFARLLVLILFH